MSYTLQQSINWASGYVQGMPLAAWTGSEPAVSIASMIRSTILSAPFTWSFNRGTDSSVTTTIGGQDYTVALTDFGFLEKASVNDGTTIWEIKDIQNTAPMAVSNTKARPSSVTVQSQVPGTSISIRLSAVPDKAYPINLIYQKAPILFAATTDNWGPLPDSFNFIFNNLFLGEALADADDQRAQVYRQRGVAALLARAEGLSEQDKAVFAQNYLNFGVAMSVPGLRSQQAAQARGV